MKDTITALLIIFIALKLIDLQNIGVLDAIILVLAAVLIIISLLQHLKKGRGRK